MSHSNTSVWETTLDAQLFKPLTSFTPTTIQNGLLFLKGLQSNLADSMEQ